MGRDGTINLCIGLVKHDKKQIESRKQRVRKVNVSSHALTVIVVPIDRVRSCDDTATGIKRSVYACLRNGDCLLLHNLMNSHPVCIIHLVKLVNTYNSTISQDHRSGF